MICVSLGRIDFQKALKICDSEKLVEIRYDLMDLTREELVLLFNTPASKVFTFRKEENTQQDRLSFYRLAIENRLKYIDLDYYQDQDLIPEIQNLLSGSESRLILSVHDYEKTPSLDKLKGMVREIHEEQPDIIKIACMVNSDEDIVNLFSLYRNPYKKLVLGMGEKGMITRVAATFMGAPFTFASVSDEVRTAPGQLSKKELEEIINIMNG